MIDRLWYEATFKNIIRPQKPRQGSTFDKWVTKNSAIWQRKHFVQIRRYQHLECRDGMSMDTTDECWEDVVAYSFLSDFYDDNNNELNCLVGAAGFTKNEYGTTLEFCWIHPFFRGKGLLKNAWPKFIDYFGEFHVGEPHSHAMKGFLNRKVQQTNA